MIGSRRRGESSLLMHISTVPQSLYYFLRGQVSYVKQQGYDVECISSAGMLLEKFGNEEAIKTYPIFISRAITPLRDLISLARLGAVFLKRRPLIVHGHTPKAGLLSMLAAYATGVPIRVYHIHGLPYMTRTGLTKYLLMSLEWVSCRLSTRVFCVSASIREVAILQGLCDRKKSCVLHNGSINGVDSSLEFNPENYDQKVIRSKFGLPLSGLVVGFVGRLVADKGIYELLDAWGRLRNEFPDLSLLVVGPFEDEGGKILRQKFSDDSRIIYVGEVLSAAESYAAMDVLAFPSHREGFGLVAIEASSMGTPVVSTRIPGCEDSVQHEVTGILVRPKDAFELELALTRYLKNSDLRRKHGENGRARAVRDFRPRHIWEATVREYDLCRSAI